MTLRKHSRISNKDKKEIKEDKKDKNKKDLKVDEKEHERSNFLVLETLEEYTKLKRKEIIEIS